MLVKKGIARTQQKQSHANDFIRFVNREQQYRNIIEELQDELRRKFTLDGFEKNDGIIRDLHGKIIENINNIQLKTSKVLIDQEKDIIRFFNSKINDIKKQFEKEKIKKAKR